MVRKEVQALHPFSVYVLLELFRLCFLRLEVFFLRFRQR